MHEPVLPELDRVTLAAQEYLRVAFSTANAAELDRARTQLHEAVNALNAAVMPCA